MAGETEIQVSHFLDEHGLGPFQIRMLIWTVLIGMIDGYDIGAIAFAAPHLVQRLACCAERSRHGAHRQQFRRVCSARSYWALSATVTAARPR